jgi:hypothetical protein
MRFYRGHRDLGQIARAFGMLCLFLATLTAFLAARAGGQCHDILLQAGVDDNFSYVKSGLCTGYPQARPRLS